MSSVYLRLASPLQSWAAGRVQGHHVHTRSIPTRSGLEGLIAASLGARQGEWPVWLKTVQIEVRVDNPGRIQDDFQTINHRPESEVFLKRMWIATGEKGTPPGTFTPGGGGSTTIVRRSYLASAEFTVKFSHTDQDRVTEMAEAFTRPVFSPYLGRKAFTPTFPFVLGVGDNDLLNKAPGGARSVLTVHEVKDASESFPQRAVTVSQENLAERMEWWAKNTSIPERVSA